MHRISRVRIENFRACRDITFELHAFTPLVGPNNSGKSTVLDAILWFLTPNTLNRADFADPSEPVCVEVMVDGIDSCLLARLDPAHRNRIEPFAKDGRLRARRIATQPGMTGAKTLTLVRAPDVEKDDDEKAWANNPSGIWASISAIFPEPIRIGAMEDSVEDVAKAKNTTTLGKLIAELTDQIVAAVAGDYAAAVKDIAAKLSSEGTDRPDYLKDFDVEASEAVKEFFPGVDVKLHVPTPELKDLFKSGTITVYDDGDRREFEQLGHGAQRSIQMALVRVLADRKAAAKKETEVATRLLLVDEPELYLHPSGVQSVRDALRKLSASGYQVVISTHSPLMVEQEDAANTVILGKAPSLGSFARPTMRSAIAKVIADAPHQARTIYSLTNASEILFADRVIVAEGKTEKRLLPNLFGMVLGKSMRAHRLALLDAGGVGSVTKTREILDAMGLTSKIVVDLDFAFRGAIDATWIEADCTAILECRRMLKSLADEHHGELDATGLPMKGGALTVAEQFAALAAHGPAQTHIQTIHDILLEQDVWLWTRGAVEEHLGLAGKNESTWSSFLADAEANGWEVTVPDTHELNRFMKWIAGEHS